MDTNLGKILKERYKIKEKKSTGGMSNIYLAEDLVLNRHVILKILYKNLFNNKKNEDIFINEIKITAKLKHKNIVKLFDYFIFDGHLCLVLEQIEGKNLRILLNTKKTLGENQTINIVLQILDALVLAERNKIVHRDIKPENILIIQNKKVKILDFGVSVDKHFPSDIFKSKIIGSIKYISPEIIANQEVNAQSDLYSLGIMMFEMLVGQSPFIAKNYVLLIKKHLYEEVPRIKNYEPKISQQMENIIIKATAKNLDERYNKAETMIQDLKKCLEEETKNLKPLFLKEKVFKKEIINPVFKQQFKKETNFFWLNKKKLIAFIFVEWIIFIILIIKLIINWWKN